MGDRRSATLSRRREPNDRLCERVRPLRDDLAAIGFRLLAPHRRDRKRPSRNDGWRMRRHRRRFVVERTFGRLHGYRRLLLRHEWDAHLSDGLLRPACALIAVGKF